MSEQAPPQRHQRTEADGSGSATMSYTKSDRVWMPYGDIIQVEDTQFRPANETQIEGCPVVELTDDSAKNMELFLASFYNPFYHKIKLSFDLLAYSLRLGRKYEAPTFKQDSVQRLHTEAPKTLDLWDKRQARFRLYSLEYIYPTASVLIDLLNLAYENGVYTCIPALSFRCLSLYPLSKLFEGIDREDGLRAVLPDATKAPRRAGNQLKPPPLRGISMDFSQIYS